MRVSRKCIICESVNIIKTPAILAPFVADRIFGWKPLVIEPEFGLRDIVGSHAYSLCNTLYCLECGMLFLDMRFDEEEMGFLYKDYRGEEYTALRSLYENDYSNTNSLLEGQRAEYLETVESLLSPYLSEGIKILDVGGDDGTNTPFLQRTETIHILDISGKVPRGKAINVTLEDIVDNGYEYSLITCMQVLEHVSEPHDIVKLLAKLCGPETLVYIEIPLESLMLNPIGTFYTQKRLWHEHINFFSLSALKLLAKLHGFEILEDYCIELSNQKQIQSILCKKIV